MGFDYSLGLMTGIDLPIPEIQAVIHQPSIEEISMIGEKDYLLGVQILTLDKGNYINENSPMYHQVNNFQIFSQIMQEKDTAEQKEAIRQVMSILFPSGSVNYTPRSILLNQNGMNLIIDEDNFESFQKVLRLICCIKKSDNDDYNPANKKAQEIAEKLKKARKKIAELKAKDNGGESIFAQYLSVLFVGTGQSLLDLKKLTMYQLYDIMERYNLYIQWDIDMRARMAGAKVEKPIENWMKNIH